MPGEGRQPWLLEHRVLLEEVHVARAVYEGRGEKTAIQVINLSDKVAVHKANEVIGESTPVSVPLQGQNIKRQPDNEWGAIVVNILKEIPPEVHPDQIKQLHNLNLRYRDVFSIHDYDLGRSYVLEHTMDTGDLKPVRQALRRQPPAYQQEIDRHVNMMLTQGVIAPTNSEYAANVVLVKKKDGRTRSCVDY